MSKGLAKRIAPVLALVLVFSFVLSACGSSTTTTSSAPSAAASTSAATSAAAGSDASKASVTTSYQFGVNTWGSGVPILDLFGDEAEYALKAIGMTSLRASDDFTSDKELANVQNFCSAGVKGIVMQASAVTTFPQMAQICQTAKVPFVMDVFIGNDADRDKISASNPYYVGAIDSALVPDGKAIADQAIKDGCKTALLIGGNIGDNNMDQRVKGFTDEFTAKGGKVIAEARCTDPSESATKAEDMISAHKDASCVYALVGDYVPGPVSAIDKLGLTGKMKVYASCVDKTTADYIKSGKVASGNDGIGLAAALAPTLLLNYLDGHAIKDDSGKAPRLQTTPFEVNKTNVDAYISVFYTQGVHPITEDVLKSLCWRYNPNVTYKTYTDLIKDGLNLNAILKDHKLPTVG